MTFETLEDRRHLSATVTEAYPGFYEVHGSDGSDSIAISVSMEREEFTLDGVTYGGVAYVLVFGYGGNDSIGVSADGTGWIGASVDAGDGNDSVTVGLDGAIWGGNGNDTLTILDSFRGEVRGEDGNDSIFVSGYTAEAWIEGGEGNDRIDASGNYYGVTVSGGEGNDTIYGTNFDDELYGDEGDDVIYGNGGTDGVFA